jgi:SET domain-containing protein
MLRVKTYLAQSSIPGAGLGLFAAEDIPAGTLIWKFDDGWDLLKREADWPDDVSKSFLKTYAYLSPTSKKRLYVICIDNARFINHSARPTGTGGQSQVTVAARDIRAGEEITEDYRTFDGEANLAEMPFLEEVVEAVEA